MPQIGQLPGPLRTISGCMGQVYSTVSGSSAMPHLGHAPGLLLADFRVHGADVCDSSLAGVLCCDADGVTAFGGDDSADLYYLAFRSCVAGGLGARYFSGSALKRFTQPGLQK